VKAEREETFIAIIVISISILIVPGTRIDGRDGSVPRRRRRSRNGKRRRSAGKGEQLRPEYAVQRDGSIDSASRSSRSRRRRRRRRKKGNGNGGSG
jgi:hypothetical protein